MFKLLLVGAGKRAKDLYLPALNALSSRISIAGTVVGKDSSRAEAESVFKCRSFLSLKEATNSISFDGAVISLPPEHLASAAIECMPLAKPFLIETPFRSQEVLQGVSSLTAGVLEQKPFFPLEELKNEILQTGLLGKVLATQADFRGYDYHAIAVIRRALDAGATPTTVTASKTNLNGIDWVNAEIKFNTGQIALYQSNYLYSRKMVNSPGSFRVFCENGSLSHDTFESSSFRCLINGESKEIKLAPTYSNGGRLLQIGATLPNSQTVYWINPAPDYNLTEDQLALYSHFLAFADSVESKANRVLYPIYEGYLDSVIMDAINTSAEHGQRVNLS